MTKYLEYSDKEAKSGWEVIDKHASYLVLDNIFNTQKDYDYDRPFEKETIKIAKKICSLLKIQPKILRTNRGSIHLQFDCSDYSILILEIFSNKISYLFVPKRSIDGNAPFNYNNADEKEYDVSDKIINEIISKVNKALDGKLVELAE